MSGQLFGLWGDRGVTIQLSVGLQMTWATSICHAPVPSFTLPDSRYKAAEEREQDRRDERRQSTPIKLVREARQKVVRAQEALGRSKRGASFDHGKLNYELRQLRKEVNVLAEANEGDA